MFTKRSLIPLISFIMFFSCKKDQKTIVTNEEVDEVATTTQTYRLIDSTDTHMKIIRLSPQVIPNALDLDGDGNSDIRINFDYAHSASGIEIYETKIETLNNTAFVLCDSTYTNIYYDMCDTSTATTVFNELFPKVLSYKDSLKIAGRWRTGNLHLTHYDKSWKIPTGPGSCYVYRQSQNWPNNTWRYIGIKVKGHFGWLKMLSTDNKVNAFYEWAIEL